MFYIINSVAMKSNFIEFVKYMYTNSIYIYIYNLYSIYIYSNTVHALYNGTQVYGSCIAISIIY